MGKQNFWKLVLVGVFLFSLSGYCKIVKIAAGYGHNVALKEDGTVVTWGNNGGGQCNVPSGLSNVKAIAAGVYHNVALKEDGTVVAWGYNYYDQCNVPSGLSNVKAIAAGWWHTVALKQDGTVVAWGDNTYGQCNIPSGLSNVVAIAAGYYHSVALKQDGTVVAWGDSGPSYVPSGLNNVVAIAAGGYHTVALKQDGTVVAWGDNGDGQCNVPSGLSNVVAIAAGEKHTVALKQDGTVVAWGNNEYGQCNVPSGLNNVVAIAAGWLHTVALKQDGTVVAWGWNDYGQCNIPYGLSNGVAIAVGGGNTVGGGHTVALKQDGTVVAWGDNYSDQCDVPEGLSNVKAIAAGEWHNVALKQDGTVVAWGNNLYGQCNVPSGLSNVKAIAAGSYHNLALKQDGTVVAWGDNSSSQCNVPSDLSNVVAIAAGRLHNAALKQDGTVVAWGNNSSSQCNVFSGLNNVVAIAAGGLHNVALKQDGTVVAWGDNIYGQCNVPSGLSNVKAIAAGGYHTVALKQDGTVVAWGNNEYGQCNVPSGLSDVVAIAAGDAHTVALLKNGKVAAWGIQYFAPWEFEEQLEKGDLNGDYGVDISDVILCLRMAIGLDPVNVNLADMNNDGVVDISDVILILRKAIGLEEYTCKFKVIDQCNNPVSGAYVILHNDDGTVKDYKTTGNDGIADFGNIGQDRITLTVAWVGYSDGPYADSCLMSGIDVPYLKDRENIIKVWRETEKVGTINVSTNPPDGRIILGGKGMCFPFHYPQGSIDIYPENLQSDGKISLGGFNSTNYGFLLDQNFQNGGNYTVNLDKQLQEVSFTSNIPIELISAIAYRKNMSYLIGYGWWNTEQKTSGSFSVAKDIPDAVYWISAGSSGYDSSTNTDTWIEIEKKYSSLPDSLSINIPDLSVNSINYNGQNVSWTIGGTTEKDVTAIEITFSDVNSYSWTDWYININPSTTSWDITKLKLPHEIEGWLFNYQLSYLDVEVYNYDTVHGFDNLVQTYLENPDFPQFINEEDFAQRGLYITSSGGVGKVAPLTKGLNKNLFHPREKYKKFPF